MSKTTGAQHELRKPSNTSATTEARSGGGTKKDPLPENGGIMGHADEDPNNRQGSNTSARCSLCNTMALIVISILRGAD
jgi:hypothetical protein